MGGTPASGGGVNRGIPVSGGVNPFPGSSTITKSTIPLPPTSFGHGGGISSAEIPIGLSSHDLDLPVPLLPLKSIFALTTVGFVEKGPVFSP